MSYVIPIKADFSNKDELATLLSKLKTEISTISIDATESPGLAMDPATVALVFSTINVVVPTLITALAAVAVEYIKERNQRKQQKPDTSQLTIIIETDDENIQVDIDVLDIKESVTKVHLPETIEKITRIRLEL